jgi:hypothetical protein
MRDPHPTRAIGRTVVVAGWLMVLAVAGDPVWLAVPLGAALVLVWASPYLLLTNRRPAARRAGEASVTVWRGPTTGSLGSREGE